MTIKKILILTLAIFLLAILNNSWAGLIDPNKPRKTNASIYKKKPAGQALEKREAEKPLPSWLKSEPKVTTDAEKTYDINRDGKMQSSEVKIFLRDVVDEAQEKGGYRFDSPVLKEYDKNGDSVISRYEAEEINKLVR